MEKIILTGKQREALDFFNANKYLIVDAPRRSGKTTLLRALCATNPNKKIGVCCAGYTFFKYNYGMFSHCKYLSSFELFKGSTMIIGDEIYIPPLYKNIPTACAYTSQHITLRWSLQDNPFLSGESIESLKQEMTYAMWMKEFGQYDYTQANREETNTKDEY